mmetsp:Transcript_11913/g.27945  ORF Transcript_11913/g.27945 Transcript_11913/m.27945 type:complete len:85 (+) Transcript_11913:1702-1956(+)
MTICRAVRCQYAGRSSGATDANDLSENASASRAGLLFNKRMSVETKETRSKEESPHYSQPGLCFFLHEEADRAGMMDVVVKSSC